MPLGYKLTGPWNAGGISGSSSPTTHTCAARPAGTKSLLPQLERADAPHVFPYAHPKILFHAHSNFIRLPERLERRERRAGSVGVLQSVVHDGLERQPRLLGRGDDLGGGQQEAVAPGVAELEGVGVLDALVVGPVNGASTGSVWAGTEAGERRSVTWKYCKGQADGPEPGAPAALMGSPSTRCLLLTKQPGFLPSNSPEGSQPKRPTEGSQQGFSSPWGCGKVPEIAKAPLRTASVLQEPCWSGLQLLQLPTGSPGFAPWGRGLQGKVQGPKSKQNFLVCPFRRDLAQICSYQAVRKLLSNWAGRREAAAYLNLT